MKEGCHYVVGYLRPDWSIIYGDESKAKRVNSAYPMSLEEARRFLESDFDSDDQKDAKIYKLVEVK